MTLCNQNAPITQLPAEILTEILNLCDSGRTFCNLAFACKDLARRAEPALHRHRTAHRRFRYASDLDPTCFPALVRSVVLHQDPVVSRYARSVDIWGTRLSWDDWRQYEVDEHGVHMRGEVVEIQRFNEHEIKGLLALTRDLVGEEELDAARKELEHGADGLLKFLVIASCPRLQTLKFIRRNDIWHKSCQMWLEKSIRHILSHGSEWPAGLRSLHDAAFGVDAGISDERTDVIDWELRPDRDGKYALAAFLQLPAVKSLYYRTEFLLGDKHTEDDEDQVPVILPAGSSGVETLFLDNVSLVSNDFLCTMGDAPRKLETLSLRLDDYCTSIECPDTFLTALQEAHADHLKRFVFYNPQSLDGYRCDCYYPEEMERFQSLGMWFQSTEDMDLQASLDADGSEPTREEVVEAFQRSIMPKVEVLIMDGNFGASLIEEGKGSAWSYFDDAIAGLISEKASESSLLKALFVPAPNSGGDDRRRQQEDTSGDAEEELPVVYPNAVKAAEDHNVDLYVFGKGRGTADKKHALQFPQAVTKWDIPSGPEYGRRVKDGYVVFNPLTGYWRRKSDPGHGYYVEL